MTARSDRPIVTLSFAQTLDGRSATRSGVSQWISGSESLIFAHTLRARHDAIMVGVNTLCRDNPHLTVRLIEGRDPLRIVVDSTLRLPLDAVVFAPEMARGTIVATSDRAAPDRIAAVRDRGAEVIVVPANEQGRIDLTALLATLYARGVRSIMVEGGATLITALLRSRLATHVAITVAPVIMGHGLAAIGDLGIDRLDQLLRLTNVRVHHYGDDVIWEGAIVYHEVQHG